MPAEARVEEDNRIPEEIVTEMRAIGLFGLSIPETYGGLGLTMEEEVLIEVRRSCGGVLAGSRHAEPHVLPTWLISGVRPFDLTTRF